MEPRARELDGAAFDVPARSSSSAEEDKPRELPYDFDSSSSVTVVPDTGMSAVPPSVALIAVPVGLVRPLPGGKQSSVGSMRGSAGPQAFPHRGTTDSGRWNYRQ